MWLIASTSVARLVKCGWCVTWSAELHMETHVTDLMPSNSSMQHRPPSASMSAPASKTQVLSSFTAVTVRPCNTETAGVHIVAVRPGDTESQTLQVLLLSSYTSTTAAARVVVLLHFQHGSCKGCCPPTLPPRRLQGLASKQALGTP